MKKLLIFIFFPFYSFAQTDSVKVSFSEETVEKFEKTTLIDEYEKAFGGNRNINAALKVGLDFSNLNNFFINYEHKVGSAFSLNLGMKAGKIQPDLFRFMIEPRWYFRLKKRMKKGIQGDNFNGEYLGFRFDTGNESSNRNVNTYTRKFDFFRIWLPSFYMSNNYSSLNKFQLTYGRQFGNIADLTVSVGYQTIDENVYTPNLSLARTGGFGFASKKSNTWYFSINNRVSTGLFYPLNKRIKNANSCDFLLCTYEVKSMLKLNLNNVLFLDKFQKQVNLQTAYERKLFNSAFSLNTSLSYFLSNTKTTAIKSWKDTTINDKPKKIDYEFYEEKVSNLLTGFTISDQLRYYIGLNKRIKKGKSANNLNGIYIGLTGNYSFYSGKTNPKSIWYSSIYNLEFYKSTNLSYNLSLGFQQKTSKNGFVDFGILFYPGKSSTIDINNVITSKNILMGNIYLKLGFAK